jgi:biotin carboxylase
MRYIRPEQAAKELGIDRSTVYRRARKGLLLKKREDGRIMIRVESVSETTAQSCPQAVPAEAQATSSAVHSGGGQRQLVPRQGARVAFFQGVTWL